MKRYMVQITRETLAYAYVSIEAANATAAEDAALAKMDAGEIAASEWEPDDGLTTTWADATLDPASVNPDMFAPGATPIPAVCEHGHRWYCYRCEHATADEQPRELTNPQTGAIEHDHD